SERVPLVIAPHGSLLAQEFHIPGEYLLAVKRREKRFYIWGWAEYTDIFSNTKPHITRFCNELTGVTGDPLSHFSSEANNVQLTFSLHPENNCADEGCNKNDT
ncbi:MAG TPA: hypothetical protein VGQ96_00910, partial [Candidatus Eremiobacteraceae bacterium]|nr:hypothetical protein [Candidatus Eremiobacteraceae bacterium]